MAPKVHSKWIEHGWWIEIESLREPTLWITEFAIEEGRFWVALATSYGVIEALAGTADGGQTVLVRNTESVLEKYRLRKRLMLSSIPPELLLVLSPMHGLKTLEKFWKTIPEEVRNQREAKVKRFKESSRELQFEARARYIEIRRYEELQNTDPIAAEQRAPPREPEETDETYRLLAAPVQANWIPVSERSRKRHAVALDNVGEEHEEEVSERPRQHRQRLLLTGIDATDDLLPDSGSQQEDAVQRSIPIPQPLENMDVQMENLSSDIGVGGVDHGRIGLPNVDPSGAQTTITEVGSGSRLPIVGSGRRKYTSRIVVARNNARTTQRGRGPGAGRGRGRNVQERDAIIEDSFAERGSRPIEDIEIEEEEGVRTRSASGRQNPRVAVQGSPAEDYDGEDIESEDESIEEEHEDDEESPFLRNISKPLVVFPTETQYKDGYVWGYDLMFNADIDSIRNVVNAETNHRVLMDWRVNEMYERLNGLEGEEVSAITLRPIAYLYDSVNANGEAEVVEVSFSREGVVREFNFAFLKHNSERPSLPIDTLKTRWLQENIVWEPVDRQHVVAACKRAQKENMEGKMSDELYKKRFAKRKAKFLVYDSPQFYIEASVKINAKEFDRKFYTTFYENIVKLRDIWRACGSPSASSRVDDAYRAKALTMGASALHLSQGLPKHMPLGELSKRMIDYTRHAWNEDEESYEAIVKVCKDYEEGKLFFNKKAEEKWRKMAREKNVDITVDTNPTRKRMEKTWLRPLSRVSKATYLHVVKRMAAKEVVDGKRDLQDYYFNSASLTNPPKGTVAYAVDRLQRKDAVKNQIRYLMVQAGDENPLSMNDFFSINARKYGGDQGKQFTLMGKTLSNDTKMLWSSPTVKTVQSLSSFGKHIPPFVRQHFVDVKAGRKGYTGYDRDVEDVANARWDWQVAISTVQQGERPAYFHVRCTARNFFEDIYVELGKPCLWVIDCRRGGSEGVDEEWSSEDYSKVMEQLQKWMSLILRWTVIFLFPPGVYFDEAMQTKMALPETVHSLRGSWIFQPQTVQSYVHDFEHGGQRFCSVQAVGDVGIIMQYPEDATLVDNLPRGIKHVDVVFQDSWNTEVVPRAADKLERSPMELKRMVQMYLPRNWGLVTMGISVAVPEILETGFVGDEIIMMEGGAARVEYVYNTLQVTYGDKMVMVNSMSNTAEQSGMQGLGRGEPSPGRGSPETNMNVPPGMHERLPRSSSSSSNEEDRTNEAERRRLKGKRTAIDSEASSASEDGGHKDANRSSDLRSGGQSLGSVDTNAVTDAHGDIIELLEAKNDPDYEVVEKTTAVENDESLDIGTTIGEVEGTPVPTLDMSIESPYGFLMSMSLIPHEDGYFYDRKHVRYVRTGEEGQYMYERVNSILESTPIPSPTISEGVSTPVASAMVERALEFASPPPLSAIGGTSVNEEQEVVGGEEIEDISQSSAQVSETQNEAM